MNRYIILLIIIVLAGFMAKIANILITSMPEGKYFLLRIDYEDAASKTIINVADIFPFTCLHKVISGPKRLSLRYFAVEILYTFLVSFTFLKYGFSINFFKFDLLEFALLITAFTDLEGMYIFIEVNITAGVIGVILNLINKSVSLKDMLIAIVIGFVPLYLLSLLGAMGEGDAYLMAMIGAFLGWKMTLVCLFISVVIGGVIAAILMVFKHYGRKSEMPFGPPICIACIITMFYGSQLLNWYLNYAFAR